MSRPPRPLCTVFLAALSLAIAGCGTIYTRTYSPRRSYFKAPVEKPSDPASLLPLENATGSEAGIQPSLPPVAPPPPDAALPAVEAAPTVPGLPQ